MVWAYIVVAVIALVIGLSYRPKTQSAPPPGLGDIRVPQAKAGLEIPVVFGTCHVRGQNVVWWGALRTVAIRKKGGKK